MIEENTLYRNVKKQTIYKVWLSAWDFDNQQFVVYQTPEVEIPSSPIFTTQHTENLRLGYVYKCPIYKGFRWRIEWIEDEKVTINRKDLTPLTWARPASMWFSKFEPVNKEFFHDIG